MTIRNVTRKAVTVDFRTYGPVTVPVGRLAHQDGDVWFLDDWLGLFEPGSMQEHDAEFYGVALPPEAFEPTEVRLKWASGGMVAIHGPELLVIDVLKEWKKAVPGSMVQMTGVREPVFAGPDSGDVLYYWVSALWTTPAVRVVPAQDGS